MGFYNQANTELQGIIMDNSNNINSNALLYEAVDCIAKATRELEVKVGEGKSILIFLCTRCVPKFEEKSQYSESTVDRLDQSIANLRTTSKEPHLNDNSI
jgi:hypothetical protein